MTLTMASVQSSNIDAVGYDRDNKVLAVRFKNTGLYLYHGVPAEIAAELTTAESVGSHFAQNIKGRYNFTRLHLEVSSEIKG